MSHLKTCEIFLQVMCPFCNHVTNLHGRKRNLRSFTLTSKKQRWTKPIHNFDRIFFPENLSYLICYAVSFGINIFRPVGGLCSLHFSCQELSGSEVQVSAFLFFSQLYRASWCCQVFYFYPTDAQLDCSKRLLKVTLIFTLKCSYMFRFNNHHQGATIRTLPKL